MRKALFYSLVYLICYTSSYKRIATNDVIAAKPLHVISPFRHNTRKSQKIIQYYYNPRECKREGRSHRSYKGSPPATCAPGTARSFLVSRLAHQRCANLAMPTTSRSSPQTSSRPSKTRLPSSAPRRRSSGCPHARSKWRLHNRSNGART